MQRDMDTDRGRDIDQERHRDGYQHEDRDRDGDLCRGEKERSWVEVERWG